MTVTVHQAFAAVQAEVKSIEKGDRNKDQGYKFRGIDAVLDEAGPILRKHNVFIVPKPISLTSEKYTTRSGTAMRNVTVEMGYTVWGPAGDSFDGGAYGEAADSGDKAVSKAQSVAFRTFLLQSLSVPTGQPDPDEHSHERSAAPPPAPPTPVDDAKAALRAVCRRYSLDMNAVAARYLADYGHSLRDADQLAVVDAFTDVIREGAQKPAGDAVVDAAPDGPTNV